MIHSCRSDAYARSHSAALTLLPAAQQCCCCSSVLMLLLLSSAAAASRCCAVLHSVTAAAVTRCCTVLHSAALPPCCCFTVLRFVATLLTLLLMLLGCWVLHKQVLQISRERKDVYHDERCFTSRLSCNAFSNMLDLHISFHEQLFRIEDRL